MSHHVWGIGTAWLLLSASSPGLTQQPADIPTSPQIRTAGTASRTVKPDYATVTFEFTGDGATPLEAGQRVAALADSLRRAFQALGIPRDSIRAPSRWYWGRNRMEKTLATRYVTVPNGPPGATWQKQDTVYRGHDALHLSIHDLAKVGPAIDSAYAHGVIDVTDLTFRAIDLTHARDQVLRAAAKDARAQAVLIAQANGTKLGRLLGVSTEPDARMDPYAQTLSLREAVAATGSSAGTKVFAPEIPLSATVYARWELVPGP
jgi:uncharacterized protein YggE